MNALSNLGIPRDIRHVSGNGVHTFRFVNDNGQTALQMVLAASPWTPFSRLGRSHENRWQEQLPASRSVQQYRSRDLSRVGICCTALP